jgi:hypothetical protein
MSLNTILKIMFAKRNPTLGGNKVEAKWAMSGIMIENEQDQNPSTTDASCNEMAMRLRKRYPTAYLVCF